VVVSGVGKIRLLGVRSGDEPAKRLGKGTSRLFSPAEISAHRLPCDQYRHQLQRERPSRTFLQQLVLGKIVRLQYDTLARAQAFPRPYVSLQNGTLVNAEMLRIGKARVDL
jgi:hypothetical protein